MHCPHALSYHSSAKCRLATDRKKCCPVSDEWFLSFPFWFSASLPCYCLSDNNWPGAHDGSILTAPLSSLDRHSWLFAFSFLSFVSPADERCYLVAALVLKLKLMVTLKALFSSKHNHTCCCTTATAQSHALEWKKNNQFLSLFSTFFRFWTLTLTLCSVTKTIDQSTFFRVKLVPNFECRVLCNLAPKAILVKKDKVRVY